MLFVVVVYCLLLFFAVVVCCCCYFPVYSGNEYWWCISPPFPEFRGLNIKVRPEDINVSVSTDELLCGLPTSMP